MKGKTNSDTVAAILHYITEIQVKFENLIFLLAQIAELYVNWKKLDQIKKKNVQSLLMEKYLSVDG